MPRYAKKALRLMGLKDNSIVHAMNAMHELVYLAHKNGSKSVITVQYPWPICYFNSYEYKSGGCSSIYHEILGCLWNRRKGSRKLFTPLESAYWIYKRSWIKRNLINSNAIIAVSKSTKDLLISAGYPSEKIHVIYINALMPYTIDYSHYEPSDKFTYAYLSYPDQGKGVYQLVEAFGIALKRNSRLRLKIYGGLENARLVNFIRDLGLQDNIEMTRWVPFERYALMLKEILKDVDVVVVPSIVFDTWSRVVTESMLSGRAVMVTKGNGGLVEQVEDKKLDFTLMYMI